eukprot:9499517-Pyramimonas_sp.AAC.1
MRHCCGFAGVAEHGQRRSRKGQVEEPVHRCGFDRWRRGDGQGLERDHDAVDAALRCRPPDGVLRGQGVLRVRPLHDRSLHRPHR